MNDENNKHESGDNGALDEEYEEERYRWSDKSREERVQHKMLLLAILGVLFIFTIFIYFKSDASKSDEPKSNNDNSNIIDEEVDNNNNDLSEKASEIEENYKNEEGSIDLEDEKDENENSLPQDENETEVIAQDANEYEEEYLKKYSQDLIDGLKKNSKTVLDMYFDKDVDNKKWDKIATERFLKDIKDEVPDNVEKPISYEAFATENYNADEIVIGVIVEQDEGVDYYNLIYKEKDHEVKLNEIVFMWKV